MSSTTTTRTHRPDFEGAIPSQLEEAFWAYEEALMRDDVPVLQGFFVDDATALRADHRGILVGRDQIDRFRGRRGGAPARTVTEVRSQQCGPDTYLVISRSRTSQGGLGVLTQLWAVRADGSWVIRAAHVAAPSPAIDPTVWREVGSPLVPSVAEGPLEGLRVAVKDLFAVEGRPIGGGVPTYLAEATPQPRHAAAVHSLLGAGAEITGIARTDQFAYSVVGRNPHYGTPPNGAVRGGLPGGSSSGPASAVALGQADVGLATDTAGSVRVPASYQGLWGLRTTHGAVDVAGLLPLAPDFDTVGWLTRDLTTLQRVATRCLPEQAVTPSTAGHATGFTAVISPDLVALADPEVRTQFELALEKLGSTGVVREGREAVLPDLADLLETFRVVQSAQAWRTHGSWIQDHPGAVVGDEAERFAQASRITTAQDEAARAHLATLRAHLDALLSGDVLLLPTAPSAAPDAGIGSEAAQQVRIATLSMTCVASLSGRPALSAPVMETAAGPVGLSMVGAPDHDLDLLGRATAVEASLCGLDSP